jgi:hypothetical protein
MSGDSRVAAFCLKQVTIIDRGGQLINSLASSNSYHARLEAVESAARTDRVDLLWSALMDRHWRVRGVAQIHLKKRGHSDLADYYRQRFPEPAAVAGFGEIAAEPELLELTPLLDNPVPRVRFEVIRAWRNRDLRKAAPQVESRLTDTSPKVVRESIRTLKSFQVLIEAADVVAYISQAQNPKTRRILGDALNLVPRWPGLRAWLGLQEHPELFDRPVPLPEWIGVTFRYYSGPKPHELTELEAALQAVQDRLEPGVKAWIEGELGYWRKRRSEQPPGARDVS